MHERVIACAVAAGSPAPPDEQAVRAVSRVHAHALISHSVLRIAAIPHDL